MGDSYFKIQGLKIGINRQSDSFICHTLCTVYLITSLKLPNYLRVIYVVKAVSSVSNSFNTETNFAITFPFFPSMIFHPLKD